jgi:hypothetical protein
VVEAMRGGAGQGATFSVALQQHLQPAHAHNNRLVHVMLRRTQTVPSHSLTAPWEQLVRSTVAKPLD